MLTTFLNTLATIISVTSLLIVTYGALIGIISFLINEFKRFTGGKSSVSCPLKPSDSTPLKHSTMPP